MCTDLPISRPGVLYPASGRQRPPAAGNLCGWKVSLLVLPGGEAVQVVGESHYQNALDAICGGKCEEGTG
jgi:hypothetical protein